MELQEETKYINIIIIKKKYINIIIFSLKGKL